MELTTVEPGRRRRLAGRWRTRCRRTAGPLYALGCGAACLDFTLGLPGDFNVRNALTALAMVDAIGGDLDAAAVGLARRVGRRADAAGRPRPGCAAGLRRLRPHPAGRGRRAAGGRDPGAGSPCSAAAATGTRRSADRWAPRRPSTPTWSWSPTTTPELRTPRPSGREVSLARAPPCRGTASTTEVIDGGDRRSAIRLALQLARPGDVVAILGKGHELGQEVAGTVLPFSDPEVAAEEWAVLYPDLGRRPVSRVRHRDPADGRRDRRGARRAG